VYGDFGSGRPPGWNHFSEFRALFPCPYVWSDLQLFRPVAECEVVTLVAIPRIPTEVTVGGKYHGT
jgi:hypothetical protein